MDKKQTILILNNVPHLPSTSASGTSASGISSIGIVSCVSFSCEVTSGTSSSRICPSVPVVCSVWSFCGVPEMASDQLYAVINGKGH